MTAEVPLNSLGEDRIVSDLIMKHLGEPSDRVILGPGDDAALMRVDGTNTTLVVTTDPCPTPVVEELGIGGYYDWGRLAAVISLSDIAAMGARPIGLLSSTTMPGAMTVKAYEDYLRGLSDACVESGIPIVGGNVRDGSRFSATTTVLGEVPATTAFLRSGCSPGDFLIAIGENGMFWSAVLLCMQASAGTLPELTPAQHNALFQPRAKVEESLLLAGSGLVRAAIDCSDGLGEAVNRLASDSGCAAVLLRDGLSADDEVREVADIGGFDDMKLRLAWGDWQLVVAVEAESVDRAVRLVRDAGRTAEPIARMVAGQGVYIENAGGSHRVVNLFGSKRFRHDSYLTYGVAPFREMLHNVDLY